MSGERARKTAKKAAKKKANKRASYEPRKKPPPIEEADQDVPAQNPKLRPGAEKKKLARGMKHGLSKLNEERAAIAERCFKLGLGYRSVAEVLGISGSALLKWQRQYPSLKRRFRKARGAGKQFAAGALAKNIMNGNVAAQIFFLKTRVPEFRENQIEDDEQDIEDVEAYL